MDLATSTLLEILAWFLNKVEVSPIQRGEEEQQTEIKPRWNEPLTL